jgi:hypothetical protein
MPIKTENKKLYPSCWPEIRINVGERSTNRCEGSPKYPNCRAKNGERHPITGSVVVLTVAHLDHNPTNNDGFEIRMKILPLKNSNLRHWCQRCHNTYDAPFRAAGIKERKNKNQMKLFK